jgi:uncharacterized protein YbcI
MELGMSAQPPPPVGQLNQSLVNAVVRAHRDVVGRGPTKAQAFYRHDLVVVLLRDVLTTAERNLIADGRGDAVLQLRQDVQTLMRRSLIDAVERLTGSHVEAHLSANHLNPDLIAELFVLDRPITTERSPKAPG